MLLVCFDFFTNSVEESPVYIVGSTNTGKSSLFNRLLLSDFCKSDARESIHRATVSLWPGISCSKWFESIIQMTIYRVTDELTQEHIRKNEDWSLPQCWNSCKCCRFTDHWWLSLKISRSTEVAWFSVSVRWNLDRQFRRMYYSLCRHHGWLAQVSHCPNVLCQTSTSRAGKIHGTAQHQKVN